MKALWITDLHLDEDKRELCEKVLNHLFNIAVDRKVDLVINTGDTHDTKNQLFATELKMYRNFVERVTALMPLYSVIGNHDWAHPFNYDIHSLEGVKGIPNHTVVDSQCVLKVGDQRIGFMAYCWSKERFLEMRKAMGPVDRMFLHQDFNFFSYSGGKEETGSWMADELLDETKQVYVGHYHTHQQRQVGNALVTALGTAYTESLSEANQQKKCAIVNLLTGEIEFIDLPFTMHKKVAVKFGEQIPRISEEDFQNGVDFRVELYGTTEQIKAFMKDKTIPREVKDKINTRYVDKKEKRLDISVTATTREKVTKYVDHMLIQRYGSIEASPLNRDRLIEMGCNLAKD